MKSILTFILSFVLTIFLFGQPSFQKIGTSGGNHSGNESSLATSGVELYNQLGWDGVSLISQNLDAGYDNLDSECADDFTVPSGKVWNIDEIAISFFYFFIPSPDVSLTIRFYNDNAGTPGTIHTEFANVSLNSTNFINTGVIPLPSIVNLDGGTYWISVVANYGTSNGFYWDMDTDIYGNTAHFRNPSGFFGFGTGWTSLETIYPTTGDHRSLSFALYGVESKAVPFPIIGSILAFLGIGAASFFGLRKRRKKLL
jgi:hypothetical protein